MISVIVPYRNSEAWLGRCLESLQIQQGDFEFVTVNDNSIDNSKFIADAFAEADSRFVSLDNEHTSGVSGARNAGIEHAQGEYVTFLDADDEMLDGAYDAFMVAVRYKANIHQFNHLRYYTSINKLASKYANIGGLYYLDSLPQHWFGVWNKLYRRDFLADIRFKEGLQYGEDGLFNMECLAKDDRIHHADREVVTVKHRFDNKESLSKSKTAIDVITQVRAYEEFLLRQEKPNVRIAVCEELARLWGGKTFKRVFGEEYKGEG